MRYLLDTNTVSDLYEEETSQCLIIRNHLSKLNNEDEVYISILTCCELEYGFENASIDEQAVIRKQIDNILNDFEVLPLGIGVASNYGKLKKALKDTRKISRANIKKHNIDILLACTAADKSLTIISNDRIYSDIKALFPTLEYVDWTT